MDWIVKIIIGGATALAADYVVKETTGKHIHQHVFDFTAPLWAKLSESIRLCRRKFPKADKLYIRIKKALKKKCFIAKISPNQEFKPKKTNIAKIEGVSPEQLKEAGLSTDQTQELTKEDIEAMDLMQ